MHTFLYIYIWIYAHVNLFSHLNITEGGLIIKMVSVYERWGAKVGCYVHRNMYFHRDKKKQRVLLVFVFWILEDGGGKLVSVHMYIKSRRVTDQPLTADTLTVYACKQEKGYRIFLRTQTLPSHSNTVWNTEDALPGPSQCTHSLQLHYHVSAALLFTLPPSQSQHILCKEQGMEGGRKTHTQVWETLFSRAGSNPNILKRSSHRTSQRL